MKYTYKKLIIVFCEMTNCRAVKNCQNLTFNVKNPLILNINLGEFFLQHFNLHKET